MMAMAVMAMAVMAMAVMAMAVMAMAVMAMAVMAMAVMAMAVMAMAVMATAMMATTVMATMVMAMVIMATAMMATPVLLLFIIAISSSPFHRRRFTVLQSSLPVILRPRPRSSSSLSIAAIARGIIIIICCVVANSDAGFSFHADFMMGWDEDFLQQAVDICINRSGLVEDCPLFKLQDQYTAGECTIPVAKKLEAEDVRGPGLSSLPGNLPVLDGTMTANPPPEVPYSPGHTASVSGDYQPGDIFRPSQSTPATPLSIPTTPAGPSVAAVTLAISTSPSPSFKP